MPEISEIGEAIAEAYEGLPDVARFRGVDRAGLARLVTDARVTRDTFAELSAITSSDLDEGEYARIVSISATYKRAPDAAPDATLDYSGSGGVKWYVVAQDQTIWSAMFGAVGGGADDTTALLAMAAYANMFPSTVTSVRIDDVHRTTATLEFTTPDLLIHGNGKLIKAGPINNWGGLPDNLSATDNFRAASLITMAGEGQSVDGLTFSDEDGIDGETNGFGHAIAMVADRCSVKNCYFQNWVTAVNGGWGDAGAVVGSGNELYGLRVSDCEFTCRPLHINQESRGSAVILFGSDNYITGCRATADLSYGPGVKLLHAFKLEGLTDSRANPSEPLNDRGGVMSGNIVVGPFQHGLFTEGLDGTVITGNLVYSPGGDGIKLSGSRIICSENIVYVGGWWDGSPSVAGIGIHDFAGHGKQISGNIISPWRNEADDPTNYYGIYVGTGAGDSSIHNNRFLSASAARQTYTLSGETGTFAGSTDGSNTIRGTTSGNFARGAQYLADAPSVIRFGLATGPFASGETVVQDNTGWTATVDSWLDPDEATLEYGIYNFGSRTVISDNQFAPNVCAKCIYQYLGTAVTIRDNKFAGFSEYGIHIASGNTSTQGYGNFKDVIIEDNTFRDAAGVAVYPQGFANAPDIVSIRGNKFLRCATGIQWGTFALGSIKLIANGNIFDGCTTNISNPRIGEVCYKRNVGFKTAARLKGVIPASTTSISIAHGLVAAPYFTGGVGVRSRNIGSTWFTGVTSTDIVVNCSSAPASDTDVWFEVEINQPDWAA